jgi:hypothetical protein
VQHSSLSPSTLTTSKTQQQKRVKEVNFLENKIPQETNDIINEILPVLIKEQLE